MARIPLRERLWCRPGEAAPFIGLGKTYVYEKIRSGEIVSRLDGRARMIHVPSLIARFGLAGDQIEAGETNEPITPKTKAEVRAGSEASAPAVTEVKHSTKGRKVRNVDTSRAASKG